MLSPDSTENGGDNMSSNPNQSEPKNDNCEPSPTLPLYLKGQEDQDQIRENEADSNLHLEHLNKSNLSKFPDFSDLFPDSRTLNLTAELKEAGSSKQDKWEKPNNCSKLSSENLHLKHNLNQGILNAKQENLNLNFKSAQTPNMKRENRIANSNLILENQYLELLGEPLMNPEFKDQSFDTLDASETESTRGFSPDPEVSLNYLAEARPIESYNLAQNAEVLQEFTLSVLEPCDVKNQLFQVILPEHISLQDIQAEIPIRTNFDEKLVEQNHVVSSSDIRDSSPGSCEETDTPYVSPKRSKNTEKGSSSQQSLPNKHFLGKRKPNSVDIPPELVAINSGPRLRGNPRGRPRKHLTARPRGRGKGRTTVRNSVSVIHEPITRGGCSRGSSRFSSTQHLASRDQQTFFPNPSSRGSEKIPFAQTNVGSPHVSNLMESEVSNMPFKIQSQEPIKEKYFPQQHEPVVGNPQGWTWDHNAQHSAPYSGRSMEGQSNLYQENMHHIQQDQFKHYYEHLFQGRQGYINPWDMMGGSGGNYHEFYNSLRMYHNAWAQYFYQMQGMEYPGWSNPFHQFQDPNPAPSYYNASSGMEGQVYPNYTEPYGNQHIPATATSGEYYRDQQINDEQDMVEGRGGLTASTNNFSDGEVETILGSREPIIIKDLEMAEELMNSSVDVVDHVEAPLDQEQVPFV